MPSREELVEKVRERLERHGLPRLQMSVLLALTGATGFLSSFILLKLGVHSMALRYPVSVALAYGVFLLLLRVWLGLQRKGWNLDIPDVGSVGDAVLEGSGGLARGAGRFAGQGGNFGGAGASAEFQTPAVPMALAQPTPTPAASEGGGGGGFDFSLDLDEGGCFVVVAVLLIAAATVGAVVWVLWTAPILLAEVLVDGLVLTGLYRRLKHGPEPGHWLTGAIRRTWIPAVVVALLFSVAGHLLQKAVPEARSIGAAWEAISTDDRP
jgi:hypothetical protein